MIIGIGIDVAEVDRIENAIVDTRGRFIARVFTKAEAEDSLTMTNEYVHLAGYFAAKEAAIKALGLSGLHLGSWKEIEIRYNGDPRSPMLLLHGQIGKKFRQDGGGSVLLSISYRTELAIALVILHSREES